jgi:hypothetical protein
MDREKSASNKAHDIRALNHTATHSNEEERHCSMKNNVHKVIPVWLESVEKVVEAESEHAEWSVRLVTAFYVHRCTPEVVK